ncbi:MAG: META domain-containing protein [Lysobacter sp.]|nr:MAG: META domain-containing protein [Lysobacter sp.]
MRRLPTALALTLLLGACASGANAGGSPAATDVSGARKARVDKNELINVGGWKLESAHGADRAGIDALFVENAAYELKFDRDQVSVVGGCNQLRGTYSGSKRMTFEVAIATRMACKDDRNLADQRMSELLNGSYGAELLESQPMRLRLTGDDGTVLVFVATPLQL